MVISNHDRLPGIVSHGKEKAFARPQAGMLFFNDQASEAGGLIFGGRKNERGEVIDSGGSLSFDRYDANQIVQLIGVHDKEDRFAGLTVTDSVSGGPTRRRLWAGRNDDGSSSVALMDGDGRKRLVLRVGADGIPSLVFLDPSGKITKEIVSSP